MKTSEIERLFERIQRISKEIEQKYGSGFQRNVLFPDGMSVTYKVTNLKAPEQLEDDVTNLCIWVWNLKDYLKTMAVSCGKTALLVETAVDSDPYLPICADLANKLKHGTLKKSRSGKFPAMGRLECTLPHTALNSLTFKEAEVEFDVATPESAEISIPVYDDTGKLLGDVLKILEQGIVSWEKLFANLRGAS
jgi:hypothetical protein